MDEVTNGAYITVRIGQISSNSGGYYPSSIDVYSTITMIKKYKA